MYRFVIAFAVNLSLWAQAPLLDSLGSAGSRPAVHSQEFVADPNLSVGLRQISLMDLSTTALDEPLARYQLEAGDYKFCVDHKDPLVLGMTVETDSGKQVAKVGQEGDKIHGGKRCQKVSLAKGFYRIRVHRNLDVTETSVNKVAFLHADLPSVPLIGPNGPVGGFWMMVADPSVNLNGHPGHPRFHGDDLTIPGIFSNYTGRPWIMDFSDNPINVDSFLGFNDLGPVALPPRSDQMNSVERALLSSYPFDIPFADDSGSDFFSVFSFSNVGNYQFQMNVVYNTGGRPLAVGGTDFDTYGIVFQQRGGPATPINYLEVLFRYLPVGSSASQLSPGEVGLYQGCSLGASQGAVFAADQADLATLSSSVINLDQTAQFVQLGNDTAVTLYSGPNFTGTATLIKSNTCLSGPPTTRSFKIQPLETVITAGSLSCVKCQLQGVDLSGLNLSGVDFTQANLGGTTLFQTMLSGTTMSNTSLAGATFHCTSLNGTNSSHLVDLTSAILDNIKLIQDSTCENNFSYAHLTFSAFPTSLWPLADLSYAVIDGLANQQLSSQANPLNLTGAKLAGVSLQQVHLDYAVLASADLTQTLFNNSSLQHANLSAAKLFGATLNNVNLDGSNLGGAYLTKSPAGGAAASLEGAFLRNVNLSQAQLSGADFTNASFYSTNPAGTGTCTLDPQTGFTNDCATAANSVMNNTQFSGAYLFGVDFSNAQIQGVQFANTYLTGANFNNATVSVDFSVGTNSGFSGAFLQGTNLAPAKSLSGVSLQDAFVDFSSQGNTIYLVLNGNHTNFPGYWNTPGESVCAEMSYTNPSVMPADNSTITCPDGSPGACGPASPDGSNTKWKSKVDITQFASYQFDATFTPAASSPKCTFDPNWIPLQTSGPPKTRSSQAAQVLQTYSRRLQ